MHADWLVLLLLFLSYSEARYEPHIVGKQYKHSIDTHDTRAVRVEFWEPTKHINLNGVGKKGDYVVFFGSDSDRPLEYSCGNSCKVHLKQTRIGLSSVTVSASVQKLFAAPPASTGVLQLCLGPGNLFWKRPLVAEADISCIPWSRSFQPRRGGYIVQPNRYVEESVALDVHTWFMTERNYEQMRESGVTNVFVPLFGKKYWLPIVTSFYHGHKFKNVKCHFKSSFDAERVKDNQKKTEDGYSLVYKYTNFVKAVEESSGLYTVTCLGMNWDEFVPRNWTVELSKSLNITFIKGPMVIISGLVGNTVFLSDHNSFNVTLYSTSPVTTFKVERSDGLSSEGQPRVTRLVTQNAYNLLSVYGVEIPTAAEGMRATYTVAVVNKDEESVSQSVEIVKPRGMQVSVYPVETIASEGDRVTFDCTVTGDTIPNIKWTRDYQQSKTTQLKTEYISDGKGLRLTFIKARQEHSGTYVCTASDQADTRRASVNLAVWPRGSWLVGLSPPHQQQHSLNMNQGEVMREWTSEHPPLSTSSIILAVIILIMGALLMTVCVVAGAFYIYQLISSPPEDLDTPPAPPPPTEQSDEDLWESAEEMWEIVRKQSLQMDQVLKTTSKQHNSDNKDVQEATKDKTNDQRLSEGVHKSKNKRKKSKRDPTDKDITQEDEQSRDRRRRKKEKDGEHTKAKEKSEKDGERSKAKEKSADAKPRREKDGERSKAKENSADAKPRREKDGERSKAKRKEKARERDGSPRSPRSAEDKKSPSKQKKQLDTVTSL